MKKIITITGAVVTTLCLILTIGFTQEDLDRKGNCRADADKFCKDVKPGKGRLVRCLKMHEAELSQVCRDYMAEKSENAKGFMAACKDDAKKLCTRVPRGKGRVVKCLKSHQVELSEGCKAYFNKN